LNTNGGTGETHTGLKSIGFTKTTFAKEKEEKNYKNLSVRGSLTLNYTPQ